MIRYIQVNTTVKTYIWLKRNDHLQSEVFLISGVHWCIHERPNFVVDLSIFVWNRKILVLHLKGMVERLSSSQMYGNPM